MKSVLVTGGTGFIGTALTAALRARGCSVRLATRRPIAGDVHTVVGEIDGRTEWSNALDGIDTVFHLAARVHVLDEGAADPLSAFRAVNRDGTARLAEAAIEAGVRRFVYASSVKAVGETSASTPFDDDTPPCPSTDYGVSKREGEEALLALAAAIEVAILRPPLVYGPGVGANVRQLLRACARGVPLPLASVRNGRSLIARANLVDALCVAGTHPGAVGKPRFVQDGVPLSTPALIRTLAAGMGRQARLVPAPPGLLRLAAQALGKAQAAESVLGSLVVDDRGFRAATGWAPPAAAEEALRETSRWFISHGGR